MRVQHKQGSVHREIRELSEAVVIHVQFHQMFQWSKCTSRNVRPPDLDHVQYHQVGAHFERLGGWVRDRHTNNDKRQHISRETSQLNRITSVRNVRCPARVT